MSKVQTYYPKAPPLTLRQLEIRLNNDESFFCRLEGLGHTQSESLFTFSRSDSAPPSKLDLKKADEASDKKPVCKGKLWVEGKLSEVAAYRR